MHRCRGEYVKVTAVLIVVRSRNCTGQKMLSPKARTPLLPWEESEELRTPTIIEFDEYFVLHETRQTPVHYSSPVGVCTGLSVFLQSTGISRPFIIARRRGTYMDGFGLQICCGLSLEEFEYLLSYFRLLS